MKTATTSAVLPCTSQTLWAAFLNESFLKALYLEELEYRAFEVIEMSEISRKLRIVPNMNVPSVIAKLIGDNFAFEDHGTLNDTRSEWTWRLVQPTDVDRARKDVVTLQGRVCVEDIGDGQCRRTDTFSIEAKVFGLGSLIESAIKKELLRARAKEYVFFVQWLKHRREVDES